MKVLLLAAALVAVPTVFVPECVAVHDKICFTSQAQYDSYMGWDAKQQKLEEEANK